MLIAAGTYQTVRLFYSSSTTRRKVPNEFGKNKKVRSRKTTVGVWALIVWIRQINGLYRLPHSMQRKKHTETTISFLNLETVFKNATNDIAEGEKKKV